MPFPPFPYPNTSEVFSQMTSFKIKEQSTCHSRFSCLLPMPKHLDFIKAYKNSLETSMRGKQLHMELSEAAQRRSRWLLACKWILHEQRLGQPGPARMCQDWQPMTAPSSACRTNRPRQQALGDCKGRAGSICASEAAYVCVVGGQGQAVTPTNSERSGCPKKLYIKK